MILGKTLLLAAVLATAPFVATAAKAQDPHNAMMAQPRDRASDRDMHRDMRDRDMRDRDRGMHDRDMRDHDRGMHRGWHRGHHYGWRHCMMRWHHHHRVRVCR